MLSNITSISQSFSILAGLKIGFLIIFSLYFVFILVVFKQITSMDDIINEVHSSIIIKTVAIINIILAFSLFLAAVVIL